MASPFWTCSALRASWRFHKSGLWFKVMMIRPGWKALCQPCSFPYTRQGHPTPPQNENKSHHLSITEHCANNSPAFASPQQTGILDSFFEKSGFQAPYPQPLLFCFGLQPAHTLLGSGWCFSFHRFERSGCKIASGWTLRCLQGLPLKKIKRRSLCVKEKEPAEWFPLRRHLLVSQLLRHPVFNNAQENMKKELVIGALSMSRVLFLCP